jgi:microcystin-dependent protein
MDPFVGEIRMFGLNFPPKNWAFCNGQLMPISQNTALFSLLGTFYGGDGKSTFALPNLQDASPMNWGQGPGLSERFLGETGGEQNVTLLQTEMPAHAHQVPCSSAVGNATSPAGRICASARLGRSTPNLYSASTPLSQMNAAASEVVGSSFPHNNMPPYLVLNFCIALLGVYPPRQ